MIENKDDPDYYNQVPKQELANMKSILSKMPESQKDKILLSIMVDISIQEFLENQRK